jgi:hypothetical protein
MTDKVLYKKGYLIRVTSWENDADNYNTKEVQCDTEEESKEIIAFCRLFRSSSRNDGGIGNIYDCGRAGEITRASNVLWEFYQNNRVTFTEECKDADEAAEYMMEVAYEFGLSGGDYYTRVCDRIEVLYFDNDVNCKIINWK